MASNNARARPRIRLLGRNISGRRKGAGRHAEQSLLLASAQTKVVQFVARHVRAVDTPGWGRHFLAGRSPPVGLVVAVALKSLSESFGGPDSSSPDEAASRNASSAHKNTAFRAASCG